MEITIFSNLFYVYTKLIRLLTKAIPFPQDVRSCRTKKKKGETRFIFLLIIIESPLPLVAFHYLFFMHT